MAGARHSKQDQADIQAAHDAIVRAGGVCAHGEEADEPDDMEAAAIKAFMDLPDVDERYAIKSLNNTGRIGGYAVLYGDETTPDLSPERDYFTAKTDYWLGKLGPSLPLTYEHGQDTATKSMPVVGTIDTTEPRELGVWIEAQLDTAHRYHRAVKWLIDNKKIGASSEALPSYVQRRRARKANEVTVWPLAAVTLTTHPADYRQMGSIESIKSAYIAAGLDFDIPASPEPEAASEGATAQRDDARARRISLELDLLTL